MDTGAASPADPEGRRAPLDPDRWSAQWTIVLAVVGIAAWLLPHPVPVSDPQGTSEQMWDWWFPWSPNLTASRSLALRLVHPVAAAAALLLVVLLRGARRGAALLAVALAAFLASPYFPWTLGGPEAFAGHGAVGDAVRAFLGLGLLLGALCIAVGNHLRKLSAGARLGRALCVLGGTIVVSSFFVPLDGTPTIQELFDSEKLRIGWPQAVVNVLVLAYGVLGLRHLVGGADIRWLSVWTSRLARVLLVVAPIGRGAVLVALYGRISQAFRPPLSVLSVMTVKEWGELVGIFAPIGVGVAAWLEARIRARRPWAADAASIE